MTAPGLCHSRPVVRNGLCARLTLCQAARPLERGHESLITKTANVEKHITRTISLAQEQYGIDTLAPVFVTSLLSFFKSLAQNWHPVRNRPSSLELDGDYPGSSAQSFV